EYLKHQPGESHPERPERVKVLLDLASELDAAKFQLLPPQPAKRADIAATHGEEHIKLIEATARHNRYALDGDTITCRDSFAVSLLAVGGFIGLLDAVAAKDCRNGFALVRPPGHHALRNRAMGFCLFNTMAIGAEYLRRTHGAKKILIMEWDVHHGNGTQDAFYADPSVLFISTHQYPFYPGSGAANEVGSGAGEGYTINIPLPAGCADAEYAQAFHDIVVPAAEKFCPDWILVSAGFDPHRRDPLGGMGVSDEGFALMATRLLGLADRFADGKIAFLLEGGYDLAGLRGSVAAVLAAMQSGAARAGDAARSRDSQIAPLIRHIQQLHERYR
ncbi:MAG TPA: histone deacetylase, partial [Candidatus Deferrimicrobium sp.]|nr:histone deacetylase [Candidatus Deferrimicrobium sp.]